MSRVAYFEWSAAEDADPADPETWAQANPALGSRISVDFLASQQATMRPDIFGREHLGWWAATATERPINAAAWVNSLDEDSTITGRLAMALAVPLDRSSAHITVVGQRDDGLRHIEVIETRPGTTWVPARLEQLRERHSPSATVIDRGSPAGFLIADLEARGMDDLLLVGAGEFGYACGALAELVNSGGARHIGQPDLDRAAIHAGKRKLGEQWAFSRRDIDIASLEGAALANFGLTTSDSNDPADNVW